jgi:succinate dehydrogenase/fumarate reductase flavoprotein subunit
MFEGHDVIVVGAGLAGLTAARELCHAGRRCWSWRHVTGWAAAPTPASWPAVTSNWAALTCTGSNHTSSPR